MGIFTQTKKVWDGAIPYTPNLNKLSHYTLEKILGKRIICLTNSAESEKYSIPEDTLIYKTDAYKRLVYDTTGHSVMRSDVVAIAPAAVLPETTKPGHKLGYVFDSDYIKIFAIYPDGEIVDTCSDVSSTIVYSLRHVSLDILKRDIHVPSRLQEKIEFYYDVFFNKILTENKSQGRFTQIFREQERDFFRMIKKIHEDDDLDW